MGLIGNHFRNNFGVHRAWGDLPANTPGSTSWYSAWCFTRSHSGDSTVLGRNASPTGGYPGSVFFPAQTAGEMSMRADANGAFTANLYPSRAMTLAITGTGGLSATAALVITMLCALTGQGNVTAAISGLLNANAALTGNGSLNATIAAIGNMRVDLIGAGNLAATIAAFGDMEVDITVTGTGLTTANVGQAVWSSLAAANNDPGTMGELLNNSGAGGNPWTVALDGTYTSGDIMRLLAAVAAGRTDIIDLGGGSATVTFRDLNNTVDRVEADMTNSERTNVILDIT